MITSVEIKNFKSIRSLSIDLPKFTVLVGPNGSGKTNVVQALELFGDILQRGTTDPVSDRGWEQIIRRSKRPARGGITLGVDTRHTLVLPLHRSPPSPEGSTRVSRAMVVTLSARITLLGFDGGRDVAIEREEIVARHDKAELRIVADRTGWKVDAGSDPALRRLFQLDTSGSTASRTKFENGARSQSQVVDSRFSESDVVDRGVLRLFNRARFPSLWLAALMRSCRIARMRLDTSALRDDSLTRENRSAVLGPAGEGLPFAVDRLKGSGREASGSFKRVLEALQKVYPRIEDIRPHRIQPGRLTLLFKERNIEHDLGLANVSDGVLHALALLVMLEGSKERERNGSPTSSSAATGLLAIEEPENAIHPWSLRFLLEHAQASSQQILVTTHSETVVNSVKDPSSLLIVENDDRKGTIVTAARDRESALDTILSESGQKLGDIWMDGSLGGVPGR